MPKFAVVVVQDGSEQASEWSAWLEARGYPRLGVVGHKVEGGWLMPLVRAPRESDAIAHRVAVTWADWLRSKPVLA